MSEWEEFSEIIDNPDETFHIDVYSTTKAASPSGEVGKTATAHKFWTNALWLYPKETTVVEFQGKPYSVECILLVKPGFPVERGNYVVCSHRPRNPLYVVGLIDPLSHLEVLCTSPQGVKFNQVPKRRWFAINSEVRA